MGIAADVFTDKEKAEQGESILQKVQPDDLVRFGLIPEFIGRLPVAAVLEELSEEALVDILEKPKNALTKQYKKLFSFENVDLSFTDPALKAIAQEAIRRKTGARGLRSVIEEAMLDIMYEIPSMPNVKECIIDDKVILGEKQPDLVEKEEGEDSQTNDDHEQESA
jgi:ATP-dependent Clp protease ATP-binding subunit ClpX